MLKIRPTRKMYLLLTGILLGFGLIVAFRGGLGVNGVYTISQLIEMEKEIANIKNENGNLRASITQINQKLSDYRQSINNYGTILHSMEAELEKVKLHGGQYDIEGPGIEIVLNDSKKKLGPEDELQWFIIHDIDILEILNELRAAGAEAIEINGERVGANTEIRCGGPIIIIDKKRNASPFVISAIGDPKNLEAVMLAPGSYLDILEVNSIEVSVTTKENIQIKKKDNYRLNYMKKVEDGE